MAGFLLATTLLTNLVLVGIGWKAWKFGLGISTRFARLQTAILILLCGYGVVASLQDIGVQVTRLGWIDEDVGRQFTGNIHVVIVLGGLAVLAPVLWLLRKLTKEFAHIEAVTDNLVGRLPDGLTVETAGLTPRERDVVAAIGDGHLSDSQLSEALFVSPSTAATHVRNIMRKTGIKRRSDIALLAIQANASS